MSAGPLELIEGYQRTAVVAAAVRSGIADSLAERPQTAAEVAAACSCDPRATGALLGAMVALGLAERIDGEDGAAGPGPIRLSAAGAPLASTHPATDAKIVNKEWFFYDAWSGLEQSVRDGHARIAPWQQRLAEDPQRSLDFLRALDDLAERFGDELPALAPAITARGDLAGVGASRRLLDAGGGAGSHAARLQAANPGLAVSVLDLPEVQAVLWERHPEIPFLAGDLNVERLGRPAGELWDAVLLANILHDYPPERARAIVANAAQLLRDGGKLLVYEWVLEDTRDAPPAVAMFAVMMLVENEGGAAYTFSELRRWLLDAGLADVLISRGHGPIAVISASKPERGVDG